jgi:hypothetical protein
MLSRYLHIAFQIAWSNFNYTFFPLLILVGAVHVGNGDGNWGWPLIVAGALPIVA